jgi:hypothetical protein
MHLFAGYVHEVEVEKRQGDWVNEGHAQRPVVAKPVVRRLAVDGIVETQEDVRGRGV